jgi:hypothetical protein
MNDNGDEIKYFINSPFNIFMKMKEMNPHSSTKIQKYQVQLFLRGYLEIPTPRVVFSLINYIQPTLNAHITVIGSQFSKQFRGKVANK